MRFVRGLLVVAVIIGVAAAVGVIWFKREIAGPGPLQATATVVITPGTGLAGIARQLAGAGVVRASWMFEVEARVSGKSRALKAGEYRFDPGISLVAAMDKIVNREVVARYVTIPEGLVTAEILAIVTAAEGLVGEVPAMTEQGALLPETYRYEWGDARAGVVTRLQAARNVMLTALWQTRTEDLPVKSPEELMVLASIVEKETGVPDEQPRVAAVFINRLRLGMRLQSDPTVAYGIAPQGLERELTYADLSQPTPYNTYVIAGLPPAPICNPGKAAVEAVLRPAAGNDLYFVADGTGGHVFAATLDEHNRNVAHWRQFKRQTKAPAPAN